MITGGSLRIMLHQKYPNAEIRIADESYTHVHPIITRILIKANKTLNKLLKLSKKVDCDDFANGFRTMAKILWYLCFWCNSESIAVAVAEYDTRNAYSHMINLIITIHGIIAFDASTNERVIIDPYLFRFISV